MKRHKLTQVAASGCSRELAATDPLKPEPAFLSAELHATGMRHRNIKGMSNHQPPSNGRHPIDSRLTTASVATLAICALVFGTKALRTSVAVAESQTRLSAERVPEVGMTSQTPGVPALVSDREKSNTPPGTVAHAFRPRKAASVYDGGSTALPAPTALLSTASWKESPAALDSTPIERLQFALQNQSTANVTPRSLPRTTRYQRALTAMKGITIAAEEITDASRAGARLSGAVGLRSHSNFQLTADLDTPGLVPGLTVYVQVKSLSGSNVSATAGLTQNASNIDSDDFRAFGEVWAEQRLFAGRLRVKLGRIDFNSEFASTDNGGSFLNASMGYSPSIAAAPTYPLPTTALNVIVSPTSTTTVGVGVFNGQDGAPGPGGGSSRFQIAQLNQRWNLGDGRPGRFGVGVWQHTGMFERSTVAFDEPEMVQGTAGWFATLDQRLWQGAERTNGAERASASAFVQVGRADQRIAGVNQHVGAGLLIRSFSERRSQDIVGLGATRASWNGGNEFISELFYEVPVHSHLTVVGDLQRVTRRGSGLASQTGNILTLRTVVSF